MSVPERFQRLTGEWKGRNRLWLSPQDPVRESESEAKIRLKANGKFLTIEYTWTDDGKLQEGFLLLGYHSKENRVKASWIDSWHNGDHLMNCEGRITEDGSASILGHYAAPPGPEWGWRTVIEPGDGSSMRIIMYNVTPEGREELAVEAVYDRISRSVG